MLIVLSIVMSISIFIHHAIIFTLTECDESCDESCSGAGPQECDSCKEGWEEKETQGCTGSTSITQNNISHKDIFHRFGHQS